MVRIYTKGAPDKLFHENMVAGVLDSNMELHGLDD